VPGSAILDPDVIVDSLVTDVIDGLREELHPQFGVRAYRVYTVKQTWSGKVVGEGAVSEVVSEIRPQPKVLEWGDSLRLDLKNCGLDEIGEIRLIEWSLTYTQAEVDGGPLGKNQAWFIRIGEAHGQASRDFETVHNRPPFIDREKNMGWVVWVRPVK